MQLSVQSCTLIKRYKRFLADVTLANGDTVTMHVANTGAMTGCATPGDTVWYSTSDNPKRKYQHSWELTQTQQDNHFICVNTAKANTLAVSAIKSGIVSELQHYDSLHTEVKYGSEKSRVDIMLKHSCDNNSVQQTYIEVKSATLLQNGQGFFPDAVTTRGQKHLRELMQMVNEGHRAVLFFAVLHTGINSVSVADHIDPKYGELLREAKAKGVEIIAYKANISPDEIALTQPLEVIL